MRGDVSTKLVNTVRRGAPLTTFLLGKTTIRPGQQTLHKQHCFCSVSHQYNRKSTKLSNLSWERGVRVLSVSQSHLSSPFFPWLALPPSTHHVKHSKQARTNDIYDIVIYTLTEGEVYLTCACTQSAF